MKKSIIIIVCSIFVVLIWVSYTFITRNTHKNFNQMKIHKDIKFYINKIRNRDSIVAIEAEMNDKSRGFGYPTTQKFLISISYYDGICELFSGQSWPYVVKNEQSERKYQLGSIYIKIPNSEQVIIDFFAPGRGALEYSIDGDFFIVDTGDTDGGVALLELLNEAYKSAKTE